MSPTKKGTGTTENTAIGDRRRRRTSAPSTPSAPAPSMGVGSDPVADGRSARRTRTRRLILDAASELFADKGFSGTSTDDVAERAGVSKGSIFYNFGSKEALGESVITEGAAQLHQVVAGAHRDNSGWQALSEAAMAVLQSVDQAPDRCQVLSTELFRPGRNWHDKLAEVRRHLLEPLIDILVEVHDERRRSGIAKLSQVTDPAHFEAIAMSVMGALMFTAFDRRAFGSGASLEDVHERLMVTISGLRG